MAKLKRLLGVDRGEQVATVSAHKPLDRIDGDAVAGVSGLKAFAQARFAFSQGRGDATGDLKHNAHAISGASLISRAMVRGLGQGR